LFIETIQASKTVYQKQQILHDHDKRKTKEKKNPSPLSSYFKKKKKKKKKKNESSHGVGSQMSQIFVCFHFKKYLKSLV